MNMLIWRPHKICILRPLEDSLCCLRLGLGSCLARSSHITFWSTATSPQLAVLPDWRPHKLGTVTPTCSLDPLCLKKPHEWSFFQALLFQLGDLFPEKWRKGSELPPSTSVAIPPHRLGQHYSPHLDATELDLKVKRSQSHWPLDQRTSLEMALFHSFLWLSNIPHI